MTRSRPWARRRGWRFRASRAAFSYPTRLRLRTVGDILRYGGACFDEFELFFGHGTDNALDEALVLVAGALHLSLPLGHEQLHARLSPNEKRAVLKLFRRRICERTPASYLVGRAWFAGLEFAVDSRVLIPRSPLAEWIERGFEPWLDPNKVRRVLEVGTGSGCIAIACAYAFPNATVDAVDISENAMAVARANVQAHGLAARVRVYPSDLYESVQGTYDLIVSNPPYVPAASLSRLPVEYRHEPRDALWAGADGLKYVLPLLDEVEPLLCEGGALVIEVGESRAALERLRPHSPMIWLDLARGGDHIFLVSRDDL